MNKDMMIKLFIFTAGAAIGSAVTWNALKTKYEQIANEEIESVKRHYKMKETGEQVVKGFEAGIKDAESMDQYESLIKRYSGQDGIESVVSNGKAKSTLKQTPDGNLEFKKEEEKVEKPYVISPDEFGEIDEYETISLTLYSDGVLADDQGNAIDDVEETVGKDSLNHFGEYEEDSVFVRNDERRCDYEILADDLTYEDAMSL